MSVEKDLEKEEEEQVIIEWRVYLLRAYPKKTAQLIFLLFIANAILFLIYHNILLSVIGAVILLGAVCDYLLPIKYKLTTKAAYYNNIFSKKKILWKDVKSCYLSDIGIKLSPFSRKTWLENFRGFVLRFNENKEEVIENVRKLAVNRK